MRELEAEAVAFVVGQAVGLEMGTTSADYIQIYNGNATILTESLEAIQNSSAIILSAISPKQRPKKIQNVARGYASTAASSATCGRHHHLPVGELGWRPRTPCDDV